MKQPRKPGLKGWAALTLAAVLGAGGYVGSDVAGTHLQDAFNSKTQSAPTAMLETTTPSADLPTPMLAVSSLQEKYNAVAAMPPTLLEAIIADDVVAMQTSMAQGRWGLRDGNDAVLRLAASFGSWNVTANALSLGADVHAGNEAALRDAARTGDPSIVQMLVDRGADVHVMDEYPLRIASAFGHGQVVSYLLERGARADSSMINLVAASAEAAPEMKEKAQGVTQQLKRALQRQAASQQDFQGF